MAGFDMLTAVKTNLGITGTYQDAVISGHISDVEAYMIGAGVNLTLIDSAASVGIVSRGVADLWNYGAGEGKLSEYFYQRLIQLAYTEVS